MEPIEYNVSESSKCNSHDDDHGWKKVVSRKRNLKQKPADEEANGNQPTGENVNVEAMNKNHKAKKTKKSKPKKEMKPIVPFSEAAAKIDPSHLAAYLVEISKTYAYEPEVQLLRFIYYFERETSGVQFPWSKMLKESPLRKLIDVINVPLSHIPELVYKTSVDWIDQLPIMTLCGFVLFSCNRIFTKLAAQQGGDKGGEDPLATFIALGMVLRSKPNALAIVLPTLREKRKYQGHNKLPLIVWMTAQASQGDLSVGLYSWARNLLPLVGRNPQSRDLILQLVEEILSNPKARTILVNCAVREKERLIPPPSFEILLRLTFPTSSARATERFEAIYPLLKEVVLAGSKTVKQVTQQIFTFSLKQVFSKENHVLAKEATEIAIWYVTENFDCLEHWDNLYEENIEASVALLKNLVDEWKVHSQKLSSSQIDTLTLNQTMKSFILKNEKIITEGGAKASLYKLTNIAK